MTSDEPRLSSLVEIALVREAVQALRAVGRRVVASEDHPPQYRIDHGPALTSGQITAFAFELGLTGEIP